MKLPAALFLFVVGVSATDQVVSVVCSKRRTPLAAMLFKLDLHSETTKRSLLTVNNDFAFLPPHHQALRGGRNLQGNEWACTEIDVESFGIPEFGEDFEGLCPLFEDAVANPFPDTPRKFLNVNKKILRTCCKSPTGDAVPECCRCLRTMSEDNFSFFFKSLNGQNECPGIFEGGNPLDVTFVSATDVAPGLVKKVYGSQ
jgi:hypothetical protein